MSHRLYHTEGLILARRHYGEANAIYQILTPDLGLLAVSAQGVRYLKSKLRSQLAILGHIQLSLVRGREVWRLVAVEKTSLLADLFLSPTKLAIWARVAGLCRRLVHGEEGNPTLFADLKTGLVALGRASNSAENHYELGLVLRLLAHLGYIKPEPALAAWLQADFWRLTTIPSIEPSAEQVILAINHGLEQSQL